ncbi:hypothetical protein GCM10009557_47190 [Virgisporangium ochraceum]|uniref:Uncharacterized protein n=1 Tax=Virgisporangium ochraceum TaxID=65505 RepID=A0A8J4A780_9ACTN|nr:hypothetical protein Voc01_100820 [Virgisporangium ochraceum]
MTAAPDPSHPGSPDAGSRTLRNLVDGILAVLRGAGGIRRRRAAARQDFAHAPVAPTAQAAEETVTPPSDEHGGWPTWRTPR